MPLPSLARWRIVCTILATLIGVAALARPAAAQIGSERYASIVIDAASGNILSAANPDELRYPASLTKMMTLYMLFEALRDRRVALTQYVPISPVAASMSPTKLGLVPGSLITVEQAILGLVTKSANDAASALGEMLGGDEDRFAQMMTVRARALGMARTQFRNASGLPDWNQVTTARDMAILARHLVQDFPGYYHYFSTPSFIFQGRYVPNHQRLLQTYPGADGLKTGFTDASGCNVVTSAVHGDTRLIGVVLGASTGAERDAHMTMLLDQGFDRMGVPPVTMARREPGFRIPGLISVAHAAPAASATAMTAATLPYPRRAAGRLAHAEAPPLRAPETARPAATRPAPRRPAQDQHVERLDRPTAIPFATRTPVPARLRETSARVQVIHPGDTRAYDTRSYDTRSYDNRNYDGRTAHPFGTQRFPG